MRRVSPIAMVFVAVGLFRLSLVGRGAMAFLDETMYYKAVLALGELRDGHPTAALMHIASNNGRPGNAMLELVPAALQAIPFAFGVAPSNPRSLMIPVALNVLVSMVALYLFWRISLLLFDGDRVMSTTAVVVYGLLANSNVYVRHLLACEPALCVGLAAVWLALSRDKSGFRALAIGMLAGFLVTVYPGYYAFALIPGAALAGTASDTSNRLRRVAGFAGGAVTAIAAVDILCRIGGGSFLESARTLSRTVTQGSFDEGWIFVPRYLVQVERYAGVVLLCGVTAYGCRLVWEVARGGHARPLHWLIVPALAGWAWQAASSSYAHNMVLYGRLIHPWMAFMVWATVDAIGWTRRATLKTTLCAIAIGASVVSFSTFAIDYARVAYPADVLYAMRIDTAHLPASQRLCDLQPYYFYDSPPPLNPRTGDPYSTRTDYVLVNFCQGAPISTPSLASDPAATSWPLVFRAPHFMSFRAYGFEGLTPEERQEIRRPAYDLQVYSAGH